MEKPYLTDTDLIEALNLISETARTLAQEVKLLPKQGEEKTMKTKQCQMCCDHKSVADDMYLIHGMVLCEDCAFHICQADYLLRVQTETMKLYYDNNGHLLGNSHALDPRDVIRLTLGAHKVAFKLLQPSKTDLDF